MKWKTNTEEIIGRVCIALVIFASAFLLGMFISNKKTQAETEKKEPNIIYITDDMTWEEATEIIENRKGSIVIEVVVGVVEDDNGNGHTINTVRNQYVKYNENEFTYGDEVLSIFVYNPNNNIWDDIIDRQDFLIHDEPKQEMSLSDIACLINNRDISYEETYEIAIENGYIWDSPTQMIEELVQMGYLVKTQHEYYQYKLVENEK